VWIHAADDKLIFSRIRSAIWQPNLHAESTGIGLRMLFSASPKTLTGQRSGHPVIRRETLTNSFPAFAEFAFFSSPLRLPDTHWIRKSLILEGIISLFEVACEGTVTDKENLC
jgi:hypothetical protein